MNRYMLIFTALVIGTFLTALLARSMPLQRRNPFGDPLPNPFGFVIPAVAFTLFSGLRDSIGDTFMYMYSYRLLDPAEMEPVPFQIDGGILYPFFQYHLRLRYDEPYTLLMVCAIFAIVPTIYILYKYSATYELAIALFVLTGYFSFSMNAMRQYAAAGIYLLGTKYLLSEKKSDFVKYLIIVLLAWLWHSSALILIPLYFVVRRRAWTPLTTLLLLGTVLLTLTFNSFLSSFLDVLEDTDFSIYAETDWFTSGQEEGSNIIRVFVLIIPLVMAYFARERMFELYGRKWEIMVNMSIINLAFYILSLYNWIFARLAVYTSIYTIIMMTYVIRDGYSQPGQNNVIYPVSLGMYSLYFYNIAYSITDYRSVFF